MSVCGEMIAYHQLTSARSAQGLQYICRASLKLDLLNQVGKCFKSALPPCLFQCITQLCAVHRGQPLSFLGGSVLLCPRTKFEQRQQKTYLSWSTVKMQEL